MNFKHLHYFWATAKAGSLTRAGEQLHTTPQTLSGQIKLLEERLGCKLFRKHGRNLELTADGQVALKYADDIFGLGAELEAAMGQARSAHVGIDFRVGVADSVPKAIAYRLLEPALDVGRGSETAVGAGIAGMVGIEAGSAVQMACHEGKLEDLLARLAVNKLDLVIADEPMSRQLSVKAFNHALGSTSMTFYAASSLKRTLAGRFPHNLHRAPILIQGASSAIRKRLDLWLAKHHIRPNVIGEFDDGALMTAFGREGRGVFMAPTVLEAETRAQFGVEPIGRTDELVEEFFAISVERRITHPCVAAITHAARGQLFNA